MKLSYKHGLRSQADSKYRGDIDLTLLERSTNPVHISSPNIFSDLVTVNRVQRPLLCQVDNNREVTRVLDLVGRTHRNQMRLGRETGSLQRESLNSKHMLLFVNKPNRRVSVIKRYYRNIRVLHVDYKLLPR